ncbi:ParB/RepB/Spo0J family partition protein [Streptomyces sp. NPDC006984]|uniref:ParB/RepB/Spo0J family partition protein n=1 Tax=Streptomyces sp. NPDC006984 TaxID=3155463 RepID=UPI0033E8F89D
MSSKASKLGQGTSFAQTQTVSARRQAINAATSAPTEGTPPPVTLPVNLISLNPANPRSTLGDLSQLAGSLRDHGQKQAITIMSRFSYLEAHPDRAEELEEGAKYVAIDGNSRLAAARDAGLVEIKVMIDEELGSTADELLESALVANIHRNDLDPLDEARALQQLLQVVGTQDALATRLHRSQGWVSQRLALLGLTPELKEKLVSGEESAELLRRVGNKRPDEQATHLERLKAKKTAAKRVPAPAQSSAPAAGEREAEAEAAASADESHYGVMKTAEDAGERHEPEPEASVPDPRSAPPTPGPAQIKMPWKNGAAAMEIAFVKLTQHDQREAALARYIELTGGVEAFAEELRASTSPEFRATLADLLT